MTDEQFPYVQRLPHDQKPQPPRPLGRLAAKLARTDLQQPDPWEGLQAVVDVSLEKLRAELSKTSGGVVLQGAEVRQLRTGGASTKVSGSACRVMGWSMRETTGGAPATVYLRDGRDNTGALVAVAQIAAGASFSQQWMEAGLSVVDAVFVDVAAGQIEGAVYLGAVE